MSIRVKIISIFLILVLLMLSMVIYLISHSNTLLFFDFVLLIIFFVLIITLLIISYIILADSIIKPINQIKECTKEVIDGNFENKIDIKNKDEIGELAITFNKMIDNLKEYKKNFEQKVTERTITLERMNKLMVGRELRMVELKKEIEGLKNNDRPHQILENKSDISWAQKFKEGIDLEESLILKLRDYYIFKINKAGLNDAYRKKCLDNLGVLINDSINHKQHLEDLWKYETNK